MDTDVIVIGAGPTGLMLAAELRLGGAEVTVFERRAERSWESRGVGFTARATEIFAQRGLLERLPNAEITRQGHFGGIPIDYGILEGSHFGVRGVPQYKIEEMLEARALELGVSLRRGYEFTGLTDTGDGVTVTVEGPSGQAEFTARYLVGCDGGRSTVRQLAGFEFPGSDATREMYLADVTGCEIRPRMIGELVPNGMVMAAALEKGFFRIIVCENGTPPPDKSRQVTFTEVADAWQRLTGESIHGGEARWVSSFTDATRQASEYRRGRVLLAGDAAHIHLPAGGQGLSIGVQDAVNLGWKLAATVGGWAPDGLLDTYHSERHPVGARVLRNTRAQGTLNLSGSSVEPLRTVMKELIAIPAVARHLSGMVSGLDIRYEGQADGQAGGHPLLGARMADRELELADGGPEQIARLLHPARGVLICAEDSDETSRIAAGWSHRVDLVSVKSWPAGPEEGTAQTDSVLIRPDGYVAWVAPDGGQLADALQRWFGAARPPVPSAVRETEHEITVDAPAQRVFALIADVTQWPETFPPTVHAEVVERDGNSELIRIWATANGTAKTWTSRRQHDPDQLAVTFRQARSQHPVGGMGGKWVVEPVSQTQCRVRLLHDFFAATDDPADLDWISQAVDRNSGSELQALKTSAELTEAGQLITFDDTVMVDGSAKDVYDFINEAQLWSQRLPHVARVSLTEDTPGLQILEMDTSTKDGSVHTTRSVRVCQPYTSIVYKQVVVPALMTLHTGRWLIAERDGGGVSVTSRHTVLINTANITKVLGPDADAAAAEKFVRNALSTNSLTTLRAAKAYAEDSAGLRSKAASNGLAAS
jgi:2-polyprenyl-6-methoxyphenol hydroxylase-like FAD-dependent oxidoreductase/ribosome-associated toxin RatA of RatAB toxin-antitoxin module